MTFGHSKLFLLAGSVLLLAVPLVAFATIIGPPPPAPGGFVDIGPFIRVPVPFYGAPGPAGSLNFGDLVLIVLEIVLLIVGALAVLSLIWGGFRYVTAYGNEEAAEAAKRIIRHSVLGLIIVILSFAMVTIISNVLILGTP